jgi:hypothetical protein
MFVDRFRNDLFRFLRFKERDPTAPASLRAAVGFLFVWMLASPLAAGAIVVQPTPEHVRTAMERGQAAARARTPPNELYAWFGGASELEPRGFLMTKLAGLAVMATHFALRSEQPAEADIRQILDEATMLVSVTLYGDRPTFARDSYMVLTQGTKTIKPTKVRFDGHAILAPTWPKTPPYRAKVVASFLYEEFDPLAATRISIFPSGGGEVSFDVDFSKVE